MLPIVPPKSLSQSKRLLFNPRLGWKELLDALSGDLQFHLNYLYSLGTLSGLEMPICNKWHIGTAEDVLGNHWPLANFQHVHVCLGLGGTCNRLRFQS